MTHTRSRRLRILKDNDIGNCKRCPLHRYRKNIVVARGDADAPLMFIGEAPGEDEDEQGLPFVGKAGALLDDMIVAMGWHPDLVYIANIIKCRPPENRYPTKEEIFSCKPFVQRQIEIKQPAVLVLMGNLATKTLLGIEDGIMSIRGAWREYKGIPVMPTYHPAFALRQPSAKRPMWKDAQAVVRRLHELGHPSPNRVRRSKGLA